MFEEPRQLYPGQFILFIGPPATGKTMSVVPVAEIIKHPRLSSTNEFSQVQNSIPFAPDSITLEALTQDLATSCVRIHKYKNEKGEEKKYVHSSICLLVEELGVLLRKDMHDFINVLTQGYDARSIHRKTKGSGEDNIQNVCFNLIAGATPKFMKDSFDAKLIGEGFASRFILVYEAGPRFLRSFPGFNDDQRKAYKDVFLHVEKLTKVFGELKFSPESDAFFKEEYESGRLTTQRANTDVRLDYYYGRKKVHWLKMCMVKHFSEPENIGKNIIELPTIKSALEVFAPLEPNMHKALASASKNTLDDVVSQMKNVIKQSGNLGISGSRFKMIFYSQVTTAEQEECLKFLIETGQIYRAGKNLVAVKEPVIEIAVKQ